MRSVVRRYDIYTVLIGFHFCLFTFALILMEITPQSSKLSSSDRLTAAVLRTAPWLAFFIVALPAPLYFLLRYFTSPEEAGVYMLLVLTSLAFSVVAGLFVALLFFLYRKHWEKKMRERLAADGVTVSELGWFRAEMKPAERRALKQIEGQNALLADAYRETLAARLTATRVVKNARREMALVGRRLHQSSQVAGADRARLEEELRADRLRLERTTNEAVAHEAEAETRLRLLEAAGSRHASEAETEIALQRLGLMRGQTPYALEAARLESEARSQADEILRQRDRQLPE